MAWRCLALSRNFNQHYDIVNWTHVSKFLRNVNRNTINSWKQMHMRIMSEKLAIMVRPQYDKVVVQSRRNIIVHLKKRKYLCSDWNFTDMYLVEYVWQKHAHLVHVGLYKFVNMVMSRHIGAEYNAATLTYTRATMQNFVQILTDYLRFDNKIGMDASNLKSVLVQAMAWGGKQQAIAWVTVDEYNNILY